MYLENIFKNKLTIGKQLRLKKKLYYTDHSAIEIQLPQSLKQYKQELIQKGVQINKIGFANFYTKNGLKYSGLIARQKILANTVMLKVPVSCLLTTGHAIQSQIKRVFEQNPIFFAKRFNGDWQDHILLAYLLYEYQKGQKSTWYNLIRNLPREIDYAIFWSKQQLKQMEDEWIINEIEHERNKFEKQCTDFITICSKYTQYFQKETLTHENIQWIYTHLVTRCFGKYFNYTTMVPFAELFNHQCVDVYYTTYYEPNNPNSSNQKLLQEVELTEQDKQQACSSDGSYNTDDYYDCNEDLFPSQNIISTIPISGQIQQNISQLSLFLTTYINFNDNISLQYLCEIYQQIYQIKNNQKLIDEEKIKFFINIYNSNQNYVKIIKQFYSKINQKMYSFGVKQKYKRKQIIIDDIPKQNQNYFEKSYPKDNFNDFLMLCSSKDQFQKGAQVYFCYGRLPNKLLLLRYGISLEYNKYDHLYLRIDISSQIQSCIAIHQILQNVSMSKYKRFKLKRNKICLELITFLRCNKWKYNEDVTTIFSPKCLKKQLQVLQDGLQLCKNHLNHYKDTLENNQKKLIDKTIGYHKFFALIYKIEQQRILQIHIEMFQYAIQIINKQFHNKDTTIKSILQNEKQNHKLTLQIMMQNYLELLVKQ